LTRVLSVNADLFLFATLTLKVNFAVDEGKDSVVFTDTHIRARVNPRAPLPDDDVTRPDQLAVLPFYPQAFGLAIAAVAGAADTFFMGE